MFFLVSFSISAYKTVYEYNRLNINIDDHVARTLQIKFFPSHLGV